MIDIKFIKEENRAVAYDGETEIGECEFKEIGDTWNIVHTGVNNEYQGKGIAKNLVNCVIKKAKEYSKNIIAECSYAIKILKNK